MQLNAPLGVFGGTFDPIHNGHILPILEGAKKAGIQRVALMPCFIPSHKGTATVSSEHRLNMVKLVCQQHPIFYPDPRDILRAKPTFSLDSFRELRTEYPTTPLCFFIGTDSLHSLTRWHQWQELFTYCHFVVCQRATDDKKKQQNPESLDPLLQKKLTQDPLALHQQLGGSIYLANTQPLTVSSTLIRAQLTSGQDVNNFVPSEVVNYIQQHKLYQPESEI